MGQIWQSSVKPLLDPKFKPKLENQSESDFFEDSKALVFISFIRDSYGNQGQSEIARSFLVGCVSCCGIMAKMEGFSTTELDEESTKYLKKRFEYGHLAQDVDLSIHSMGH